MEKLKQKIVFLTLLSTFNFLSADELKLGFNALEMNYEETSKTGGFLDSEKSYFKDIAGFNLSYEKNLKKSFQTNQITSLKVSFRYFEGDTRYDGFLQSTLTGQIIAPYKTTTKNKIYEPKITLSQTAYTKNYEAKVFTSYGYRYWNRDIQGSFGLEEIYKWQYFDVGLGGTFYDRSWDLGFEVAYQEAIKPTMSANIKGGLDFDLGKTSGYYYKTALGYNFNKNWRFEGFYEYNEWKIKASNVVLGFYEPDSSTKNKIVGFNLVYIF